MTTTAETIRIERADPSAPILVSSGKTDLAILAGTVIEIDGRGHAFKADTPVELSDLAPGQDYGIRFDDSGRPHAIRAPSNPIELGYVAGFHFAPGGCAPARAGGDATPSINPYSLWDMGYRPACADPRGMFYAVGGSNRLWADIYLLGTSHETDGTSRFGVEIADGASLDLLDYATATEIVAKHGKRLMTYDEFKLVAHGVTERSSADRDPRKTGLDAARTSRFGVMQATGNLWIWGADGDPDDPRPSIFGGSWLDGSDAGSRYAHLVYWPGDSDGSIGVRAACDHLDPA